MLRLICLIDLYVIFYLSHREVTSENRSLPWVEERFAILDRNRLKKEKEEKLRLEVQLRWTHLTYTNSSLTLCILEPPKRVLSGPTNRAHTPILPFLYGKPKTVTLAYSEEQDKMQHNAAFHQDLHCLL